MKKRLLTALVAAGCFSQMAVAADLTTGSITNRTTATATVTINQPVTLENTLTPLTGLTAGKELKVADDIILAMGKLAIKEPGVKARLAVMGSIDRNTPFKTYATGHENDDAYMLRYEAEFKNSSIHKDELYASEGAYDVTREDVNSVEYIVACVGEVFPKAGNYVISITAGVYNP